MLRLVLLWCALRGMHLGPFGASLPLFTFRPSIQIFKFSVNEFVKIPLNIDIRLMLFRLYVILEVLVVCPAYPAVLVVWYRDFHRTIYRLYYADVTPAQFNIFLESFLPHVLNQSLILHTVLHFGIGGYYHEVFICTLMVLV